MSNEPGDYNPYQSQGSYPGGPQYGGDPSQGGYDVSGYDQGYAGGYGGYGQQPPQGSGLGKVIAIIVGAALGAALLLSAGFIFFLVNKDDGGRVIGDPTTSSSSSSTSSSSTSASEGSYGSDPALDTLYDSCKGGNNADCDSLYWRAPLGSEYEEYGRGCAGRGRPDGSVSCEGSGGSSSSSSSSSSSGSTPDAYGSDPELDRLYDTCKGGNNADCDSLYLQAPLGSDYEEFGQTCGGRGRPEGKIFCDS